MDVTTLATAYLGTRQVNLREVRNWCSTPADLKGVKLRMPGCKEWLFLGEALGATATPLAFGEVYLGLKTGTIDGQDNPLPTVRAAKFYEVTKQLVLTSHLVDGIFIAISNKSLECTDARAEAKRARRRPSRRAVQQREPHQAKRASSWTSSSQGRLAGHQPDVDAFRKAVQGAYAEVGLRQSLARRVCWTASTPRD